MQPAADGVLSRIVCQVINECAFALGEGVGSAADIDTGMVLGLNYPRGPLAWADQIGLDHVLAVLDGLWEEYHEERYRSAPELKRLVRAGQLGRRYGSGLLLLPRSLSDLTFPSPVAFNHREPKAGSALRHRSPKTAQERATRTNRARGAAPFQRFLDAYRDDVWRFLVSSVGPRTRRTAFRRRSSRRCAPIRVCVQTRI